MDWVYLLALVYFIVSTPFTLFGIGIFYTLVYAFFSARVDRRDLDD